MQICRKKKKIMSQIEGELKTNESNSETNNEFDKYQNICDGLHILIII